MSALTGPGGGPQAGVPPTGAPPSGTRLLLAEQLMLLAFSPGDRRLRMGPGSFLSVGLVGAVLTELTLRHCIAIDERGKCRIAGPPSGDPLLDDIASWIQNEKPRTPVWWVRNGRARAWLHGQVLGRLAARGLVTTSRGAFRQRSHLAYPPARAELIARLHRALLTDSARVSQLWSADPGTASLTSLAFASEVISGFGWLPRGQRKTARASLNVIRSTDPIGQAVVSAVRTLRANATAGTLAAQAAQNAATAAALTSMG
jgi:Golgi phosphoprotein 3 (GPP34)